MTKLPGELVRQAKLLSLSTTLTTNACVEEKTGRSKLIFFGGDKTVIDRYGKEYGLPSSGEMLLQESYTSFSGDSQREPDWEMFRQRLQHGFADLDGVGIIEQNAMKNGAVIEKKAKELFTQAHRVPVVCAHELFSELNCLQRGATTLLNASLFPTIRAFLQAIQTAVRQQGIHADVVIVRSDGSLMSQEFAALRPVETLLCGPAASVLGAQALSDEENSVIVDIGGTTTDIALVKDKKPVTVVDGIQIGKWKTFVDGLYIKTFGLGGDSAIHYQNGRLTLEKYRVVPLCVAAQQHPQVLEHLRELVASGASHTKFLHEHYLLVRDIQDSPRYSQREKDFCRALKDGPLILRDAAEAAGTDIYNLEASQLIRDGVVQICGLTPTDIMHIKGDFSEYSAAASQLAAQFVANSLGISVPQLCDWVYDEIKRKLYRNIVMAILENKDPHYGKNGVGEEIQRFIDESFEHSKTGEKDPYLTPRFTTPFSLLGIGAPTNIFLPDVAAMLGTRAVIPEHYEVANALGAIMGNVTASCLVEIHPNCHAEGISSYTVFGESRQKTFQELQDAQAFALQEAKRAAVDQVKSRGAKGDIAVSASLLTRDADARDGTVYLGTAAIAHAVGAMGF